MEGAIVTQKKVQAREAFASLRQLFECTICCGDFIAPTQTGCGHVFCSGCINTVLKAKKKGGVSCPLCNRTISRRGLRARNDLTEMSKTLCDLICSMEDPEGQEFSGSSCGVAMEEEEELLSLTPGIKNPVAIVTAIKEKATEIETKTVEIPVHIPTKKRKLFKAPISSASSSMISPVQANASVVGKVDKQADGPEICEESPDEINAGNESNSHEVDKLAKRPEILIFEEIRDQNNERNNESNHPCSPLPSFSELSATQPEDEDDDVPASQGSSQSSQPLDLSVSLPSPVAAKARTPRIAMNFVQPLDFTMKKGQPIESPSVFKSPFPSNKPYVEPRSKPTDVMSPIRKRRKTSRGMIMDVLSPKRLSPFKRNLMHRFDLPEHSELENDSCDSSSVIDDDLFKNNSQANVAEGVTTDPSVTDTVQEKIVQGTNAHEFPPIVQALICSSPRQKPKTNVDTSITTPTPTSSQILEKMFRTPSVERGRLGSSNSEMFEGKLTPDGVTNSNAGKPSLSPSLFRDSEFPVIPEDYSSMMDVDSDSTSPEKKRKSNQETPTRSEIETNDKSNKLPNSSICDSDIICVDEFIKSKGNDDTCYSEAMGENGGNPGCTGVDEFSDSESENSFLAPTPPRLFNQEETGNEGQLKPSPEQIKTPSQTSNVEIGKEELIRNRSSQAHGGSSVVEDKAVDENEENLIGTDSFENMLVSDFEGGVEIEWQTGDKPVDSSILPNSQQNIAVGSQEEGNAEATVLGTVNQNFVQPEVINDSSRKFVFCPTRLSRAQLSKLSDICQKFDGEISKDYTTEVTHLVINLENNRVPQTMKYLFAVADKKWVVIFDWIECCVKEGKMVPEERFETSSYPHCDKGAKKSRITSTELFSGISFYFATPLKSTGAPLEDCKLLIKKMGGQLVNSPSAGQDNLLIIGDSLMTNKTYQDWFSGKGWVAVTWEWILDCLLTYSIVPFAKGHLITKIDGSSWNKASLPLAVAKANHSTFP